MACLVEFFGLTTNEYGEHNKDKATMSTMTVTMATSMAATPMTRMVATMATTKKVTLMVMAVATMTTTMMMSAMSMTKIGQQRCDGDNDDRTTTI